jgi:predicted phosphodiesterase
MNRRKFLGAGGVVTGLSLVGAPPAWAKEKQEEFLVNSNVHHTEIRMAGNRGKLKLMQISDLHFSHDQEADLPFQQYSQRMNKAYTKVKKWSTCEVTTTLSMVEDLLQVIKREKPDLLLLTGDILNYPSATAVAYLVNKFKSTGVPFVYTAGNHDWHYEGTAGSDEAKRKEWIGRSLLPLYQGEDPYAASRVIQGINVLWMDNSTYQLSPEQVAFYVREKKKGLPMLLFVHIPLYMPGLSVASCGHPEWGAAVDKGYAVEGRERWSADGNTPATKAFMKEVWDSPHLLSVFSGHFHDARSLYYKGVHQHIANPGFQGSFRTVEIVGGL